MVKTDRLLSACVNLIPGERVRSRLALRPKPDKPVKRATSFACATHAKPLKTASFKRPP